MRGKRWWFRRVALVVLVSVVLVVVGVVIGVVVGGCGPLQRSPECAAVVDECMKGCPELQRAGSGLDEAQWQGADVRTSCQRRCEAQCR